VAGSFELRVAAQFRDLAARVQSSNMKLVVERAGPVRAQLSEWYASWSAGAQHSLMDHHRRRGPQIAAFCENGAVLAERDSAEG